MKHALLFLVSFLSATALAQVKLPTNEAGQVQYQEVTRIADGTRPARQVFSSVHDWAEKYYPSGDEAEQQYDQQHGIMFVRAVYFSGKRIVRYTLTVEAKIGRYRATITDLIVDDNGLTRPLRATSSTVEELNRAGADTLKDRELPERIAADQADLYQQIDRACRATLASLKESMTSPGSTVK